MQFLSFLSFFKEWYKSSLYPKHSFFTSKKTLEGLQVPSAECTFSKTKTVEVFSVLENFSGRDAFFSSKRFACLRKTKKKFQKCNICVQKASWGPSLLLSCVFFFLHCFLVCISEPIRNLFWDRDAFPKWNATSKQFLGCIHKKQLPKWTEIEKGFKLVVQT